MLIQFSLTNYKNFKETQVLDFTEGKISEHPHHLITNPIDRLRLLPTAMIYGPNGCGKTNLLRALWRLRSLVLDAPSVQAEACAFSFDSDFHKKPLEYEIIFRIQEQEYDYQLKINDDGVTEENLFGRRLQDSTYQVLFDRDSEGVFLCPALEDLDVSELTDSQPLLYFLGLSQKRQQLQPVFHFFQNMIFLTGPAAGEELAETVLKTKALREELTELLRSVDPTLTEIRPLAKESTFLHTVQGRTLSLPWEEEAAGIRQLLYLGAALLEARKNGSLLLADTPELYLHPMVLEKFYQLCNRQEDNPHCAQLIAVTQENSTMNNRIFRRDELWIIAPWPDGSSTLYPLSLYLKKNGEKVRKDETYSKQYLEGRYGGIPHIR